MALAASAAFLSATPAAAAGNWYVAPTGDDVLNNCMTAATPCMNIQAAINKAAASDTIHVAAGVYVEAPSTGILSVNKTLTLQGAQSGIDARSRVGPESIISVPKGTYITASNVVIDGFTVENSIAQAFTGFGLLMGVGTTGTQVLNDIVQDNIVGVGLANTGASQVLIRHNLIQNNNQVPLGAASGQGIYTDQFVSGGAVSNVLIMENSFKGNTVAGIDVSNTDAANGVSNLDISTNSFDQNGRAVLLFNTHTSTIHDNSITNSTEPTSAAIRLCDNNSAISILNNTLLTGAGDAIKLSDCGYVTPVGAHPNSNVLINHNNIGTGGSASFAGDGLLVEPGGHVGTVNATCNWWGAKTGPTNSSNPTGTGEEVVGDANFTPWWTVPSQTSPCPPTPKCKPGEEDNGDGDVQDKDGHHRGHFHFDECDSNQEFSHQDSENNVDFHSSSADHSSPQFDANLPMATTTGHGLNNGKDVTYVLVVTQGLTPGTSLYSLTLSDASGVIYTSTGTLLSGAINVLP
jgi:hypothetical protein